MKYTGYKIRIKTVLPVFLFFVVCFAVPATAFASGQTQTSATAQMQSAVSDTVSSSSSTSSTSSTSATSTSTGTFSDTSLATGSTSASAAAVSPTPTAVSTSTATAALTSEVADASSSVAVQTVDGWRQSGTSWQYWSGGAVVTSNWEVTDACPISGEDSGLQRYWIGSDGLLAIDRLIDPSTVLDAAAGYYAYATPYGYVVRGVYADSSGNIYLADNDGVLASSGWTVTDVYGQGLQRYWIDSGEHYATVGEHAVDSSINTYVTSAGYVLRGVYADSDTLTYLADNDGVLAALPSDGWLVTDHYAGVLQRYWIVSSAHAARIGFFAVDGSTYYGVSGKGYVLRGKLVYDNDGMLLADNDGMLASTAGWLVTDIYDGELQRYSIDECCGGYMGAHTGLFSVDGNYYFGIENKGYVMRGAYFLAEGCWRYANNDGVGEIATADSLVAGYVLWALNISSDDSHGYDQAYRWGPDYDCSSFVISALQAVGLDTNGATYTGNMRSCLTAVGWIWLSMDTPLQRGDILLNESVHTALCTGVDQLVQASLNEFGDITGGQSGDQTGCEICVRSYFDCPWDGILRYVG